MPAFRLTEKGEAIVKMIRAGISDEQAHTLYVTEQRARPDILGFLMNQEAAK